MNISHLSLKIPSFFQTAQSSNDSRILQIQNLEMLHNFINTALATTSDFCRLPKQMDVIIWFFKIWKCDTTGIEQMIWIPYKICHVVAYTVFYQKHLKLNIDHARVEDLYP